MRDFLKGFWWKVDWTGIQYRLNPQAQVVQTLDSTIHLLNNWGLVAR